MTATQIGGSPLIGTGPPVRRSLAIPVFLAGLGAGYAIGKSLILLPWTDASWWAKDFAPPAIGASFAFAFSIIYFLLSRAGERRDRRRVLLRRVKWEAAANRDYFVGMQRLIRFALVRALAQQPASGPFLRRYIPSGISDEAYRAFWTSTEAKALRSSLFGRICFQANSAIVTIKKMEEAIFKLIYDSSISWTANAITDARTEAFDILAGQWDTIGDLRAAFEFIFESIDEDGFFLLA